MLRKSQPTNTPLVTTTKQNMPPPPPPSEAVDRKHQVKQALKRAFTNQPGVGPLKAVVSGSGCHMHIFYRRRLIMVFDLWTRKHVKSSFKTKTEETILKTCLNYLKK